MTWRRILCGAPGLQYICHRRAVTIHSTIRKVGGSVERTCAILRSISDKSKFEVLQRLGVERSYCQKLAEDMNINPGHMSRILMSLFQYGFLTREQEQSRYYYTTDQESISAFLTGVRRFWRKRQRALNFGSGSGMMTAAAPEKMGIAE